MPSKNDLTALKQGLQEPILPSPVPTTARTRTTSPIGRPPKPKDEKRSYKVTISLTEAQGALVKAKAGLANEAAIIYDHLVKTGFFR